MFITLPEQCVYVYLVKHNKFVFCENSDGEKAEIDTCLLTFG